MQEKKIRRGLKSRRCNRTIWNYYGLDIMPISPVDDRSIANQMQSLVNRINNFFFVGTYSISENSRIIQTLIRKVNKNNCVGIFLLPPPSDFFVWNRRWQLFRTYGVINRDIFELMRLISQNPAPAFSDYLNSRGSPTSIHRSSIGRHLKLISNLVSKGILVLFESHMHAKFITSDAGIYEGSANLSVWGVERNLENYSFYNNMNSPYVKEIYQGYMNLLDELLNDWFDWRTGQNYVELSNNLSTDLQPIIDALNIHFNPHFDNQKLNKIIQSFSPLIKMRNRLWIRPKIYSNFKIDFQFKLAEEYLNQMVFRIFTLNKKREIENKDIESINSDLVNIRKQISKASRLIIDSIEDDEQGDEIEVSIDRASNNIIDKRDEIIRTIQQQPIERR